jgi:hypothetical protein
MKHTVLGFLMALCMFGIQDADAKSKKNTKPSKEAAMQEQMAKAMALTVPGPEHEQLDVFVGKWNYRTQFWMAPNQEPQIMEGTAENQWILDGRFIQQHAKGKPVKGQPTFEGMGKTGFDRVKGTYVSTWADNMSTTLMTGTSSFDAKNNRFTEQGTYSCPITGGTKNYRGIWTLVSEDMHTYTWFTKDLEGHEYKAMEIAYQRIK